jgi:hypothetical protein
MSRVWKYPSWGTTRDGEPILLVKPSLVGLGRASRKGVNMRGHHWWRHALLAWAIAATSCATPPSTLTSLQDLTFVTRDGCVNTPDLAASLIEAVKALGLPSDYQVVNADKLPSADVRTGYPTPTLLYKGKDLIARRTRRLHRSPSSVSSAPCDDAR